MILVINDVLFITGRHQRSVVHRENITVQDIDWRCDPCSGQVP